MKHLGRKLRYRAGSVLLLVCGIGVGMLLGGCGGSSASTTSKASSTTASRAEPPPPATTIEVTLPDLIHLREGFIPKIYTCDGANKSLPVRWSNIPNGTAELALFLLSLRPVHGKTFFNWAVVGLSPTSHGLAAGSLPAGTVVGRNGFGETGYSICPPKGTVKEHYILRLLALPHKLTVTSGFDAEKVFNEAESVTKVVGLAGGVYSRP
jgi:phosphatidylethanolamine-binding protein (PEBP) family uncharacterized protein